jgi:glyoxylase-like metal-dependent hydrolase (beta-lactamase superfamily II)
MEIISGVHKIDGVRGANCYLIVSGTEMLLIDTGMTGNGNKIINYIKGLGKNPSNISFIVLTHADNDHIGSAAEMKKLTGAKLAIHANDAPILAGKSVRKTVKGPLGLLFKLMSPLMHFHPVEPDVILKDNMDIAGFKVLHTPGHTDGSISLYQPGKIIFVGDALRSDAKGNPKPPSKALSAGIEQARASVKLIAGLEFDTLLCGHGTPVKSDASAKVKNLLANWK